MRSILRDTMTNQITIEYRDFDVEYTGTNQQLQALQEVIRNAPIRNETQQAEDTFMDQQTTNITQSKQKISCVAEKAVQINL